MAPWNTLRWPLGATALAAMAIAGCGAAGNAPAHRLHATAEKRLLALVAHARADIADRRGTAAHTALAQFVSDVSTLRTSGGLSAATAGSLVRQARATASQIGKRLLTSADATEAPQTATTPTPTTTGASATSSSGSASMPPIAIPLKRDPGAKLRQPGAKPRGPALPGPGGDRPFGDHNRRFPHGAGAGHWMDWKGRGDD